MKNKILARIILIMTIAIFVTVAMTFFLFNIITINTAKSNLKKVSGSAIDELKVVNNKQEIIDKFIKYEPTEDFYKILVFDSDNEVIIKRADTKLQEEYLKSRQVQKAIEKGESFFLGNPYESKYTMNYLIKVENQNFKDGYIVYMCSIEVIYNSGPYFIVVALAAIIWAGVIFVSYLALTFNVKFATIPFEKIEEILVDINNGEYTPSQIPEKLNFPEFKAVLTKIDDIASEISKNFMNLKYEQKKSSILLQSVNQGIIIVSMSGRIVLNNATALRIFGKQQDVVGVDLSYLITDEDLLQVLRQALEDKKYYTDEVQIGEDIYRVEATFSSVNDDDVIKDEVMILIFTNVTLEVNSAKIRSEFFANASHELKTPLTAISGYSELMTMEGVSKKQLQKCIEEINANALRMKSLIDDMLKLSKLDANMDNEEITKFDLAKVCEDVLNDMKGIAENKNVSLSFEGKAEFIGRKKMIATLVSNLVNNGIKYNKDGGHVWVSVSEKPNSVEIKVKDDGIGIAKEHQGRLFERFYKVDTSRTYTNESSTGLGLAIVKRIAVIHGGKISLKSAVGSGTEFVVVFPKRLIEC